MTPYCYSPWLCMSVSLGNLVAQAPVSRTCPNCCSANDLGIFESIGQVSAGGMK